MADEAKKDDAKKDGSQDTEKKPDYKPLLFVIGTLFFWWLIATSAFVVGTCIPEGRDCVLEKIWVKSLAAQSSQPAPPSPAVTPTETPQAAPSQSRLRRVLDAITPSRRDALLFLSLLAAIWVTKGMVFPYEDLSKTKAKKETALAGAGSHK